MHFLIKGLRGGISLLLFGLFGLGALLISPLMLVLRSPAQGQPIVRAMWRLAVTAFVATGLIRLDRGNLSAVRGSVLAATHPSLIDVVLLTVLMPHTLYVAKRGLLGNPFLTLIVRVTALPDDASLPDRARPLLAAGWNLLIFPEGTRSPVTGGLQPFHRGAAQVALRNHAPLVAIAIRPSARILAKTQHAWEMGVHRVIYRFHQTPCPAQLQAGESFHAAATRVTKDLEQILCR